MSRVQFRIAPCEAHIEDSARCPTVMSPTNYFECLDEYSDLGSEGLFCIYLLEKVFSGSGMSVRQMGRELLLV